MENVSSSRKVFIPAVKAVIDKLCKMICLKKEYEVPNRGSAYFREIVKNSGVVSDLIYGILMLL